MEQHGDDDERAGYFAEVADDEDTCYCKHTEVCFNNVGIEFFVGETCDRGRVAGFRFRRNEFFASFVEMSVYKDMAFTLEKPTVTDEDKSKNNAT